MSCTATYIYRFRDSGVKGMGRTVCAACLRTGSTAPVLLKQCLLLIFNLVIIFAQIYSLSSLALTTKTVFCVRDVLAYVRVN